MPFPKSLLDTWRRSVFEPGSFFRGVPYEDAAARPVLYYLVVSIVGAFFSLWWRAIFSTAPFALMEEIELLTGAPSGPGSALVGFFLTPFAAVLWLLVASLLLQLFVLLLARDRRRLGATVRAVSYAAGPSVFNAIPFVGGLIGAVWTLVLMVFGLREAHRLSTGAAVAVLALGVLVPAALVAVLLIAVFAAAFSGLPM